MRRRLSSFCKNTLVRGRCSHWLYHTLFTRKKEMPFWNDGHSAGGITVIPMVHFTCPNRFLIIIDGKQRPLWATEY